MKNLLISFFLLFSCAVNAQMLNSTCPKPTGKMLFEAQSIVGLGALTNYQIWENGGHLFVFRLDLENKSNGSFYAIESFNSNHVVVCSGQEIYFDPHEVCNLVNGQWFYDQRIYFNNFTSF